MTNDAHHRTLSQLWTDRVYIPVIVRVRVYCGFVNIGRAELTTCTMFEHFSHLPERVGCFGALEWPLEKFPMLERGGRRWVWRRDVTQSSLGFAST